MKKILFILLALTISIYATLSVEQIEKMVNKIHEKRSGISLDTLNLTKEPFVKVEEKNEIKTFVVPSKVEEDVKISLHAIMNGKAYINDSWQEINGTVMGYTLMYIGKRGVVLRSGNHIKKLFLHENKNSLIKIEGR